MDYDKIREEVGTKVAECMISFHRAFQKAGGAIRSVEQLKELSVFEFLTQIAAQNNIRFFYDQEQADLDRKRTGRRTRTTPEILRAVREEAGEEATAQARAEQDAEVVVLTEEESFLSELDHLDDEELYRYNAGF